MLRLTLLANLLLVLTIPAIAKDRVDDDQTGHTAPALYHDRDHRQGDDHGSFSSAERNQIRSWLRDAERPRRGPAATLLRAAAGASEERRARQGSPSRLAEEADSR